MPASHSWDPFSTDDILHVSDHFIRGHDTSHHWNLQHNLETESFRLADSEVAPLSKLKPVTFQLRLDEASLEHIDGVEGTSDSGNADNEATICPTTPAHDDLDVWNIGFDHSSPSPSLLLSWDRFEGRDREGKLQKLLSEAEPRVYNRVLHQLWEKSHGETLPFARADQFHHAVANVIVGRNSAFFTWNESMQEFVQIDLSFAIDGHSPAMTKALCQDLCACGTMVRRARDFVSTKTSTATERAMQGVVAQMVPAIEHHFHLRNPQHLTYIGLHTLARRYSDILEIPNELMNNVKHAGSERQLLTQCIQYLDDRWLSRADLQPVVTMMAQYLTTPSLNQTSEQLGLSAARHENGNNTQWVLEDLLPQHKKAFYDTTECLSSMRNTGTHGTELVQNVPILKLASDWQALGRLQEQADKFEATARAGLGGHPGVSPQVSASTHAFHRVTSLSKTNPFDIDFTIPVVSDIPVPSHGSDGPSLRERTLAFLQFKHEDTGLPPLLSLGLSVQPCLSVQSRVLSFTILRKLFVEHNIVSHLELLWKFELFGDGLFASRLSSALFDADQYRADGRRKVGLTAGLRLEDREVWPPASSELRIVLMGLLSSASPTSAGKDVVECISFAIRDMSEDELEKCRDIHSIHALDFLRLAYNPSSPLLELIISPSSLDKYDRIFKFLLLLFRMHSLAQTFTAHVLSMSTPQRRAVGHVKFCLEFHHFMSQLLAFVLNIAIQTPWAALEAHLSSISQSLKRGDYENSLHLAGSVAHLRRLHENTLDDMLRTCLLVQNQATAQRTLETILLLGLRFATIMSKPQPPESHHIYQQFRNHVKTFISQVSSLGRTSQDPALSRLECLLLMLDISEYYETAYDGNLS